MSEDTGTHYRYTHTVALTEEDKRRGFVVVPLDPFRIFEVYGMDDFAMGTVLKKCLCTGTRGHNTELEDIDDMICALERKKQMLQEDTAALHAIDKENKSEQSKVLVSEPVGNNGKDRGEIRD